ncbi:MAG: hypothetical protein ACK56F_14870, partial [bacterium]
MRSSSSSWDPPFKDVLREVGRVRLVSMLCDLRERVAEPGHFVLALLDDLQHAPQLLLRRDAVEDHRRERPDVRACDVEVEVLDSVLHRHLPRQHPNHHIPVVHRERLRS